MHFTAIQTVKDLIGKKITNRSVVLIKEEDGKDMDMIQLIEMEKQSNHILVATILLILILMRLLLGIMDLFTTKTTVNKMSLFANKAE